LKDTQTFYIEQEEYLIDEYNKTIARSQLTYAQDFADYEHWSGKKINTTKLLNQTLGDENTELGQNDWGFVENYG
jgi:hypothetical protein